MKKTVLITSVLVLIGIAGCYNDKYDSLYPAPVVTCDTTSVSFANNVLPILNQYCNVAGGCHDAAGQSTSGFNFTTYPGIQNVATTAILVDDIKQTPSKGDNAMPKGLPPIPQCDINIITAWVNQGALDN